MRAACSSACCGAAEEGDRGGSVLELLVLRALALHKTGRTEDALDALRRAVAFAEPEGYVGVFADEGEPMARLLAALAKRGRRQRLPPSAPRRCGGACGCPVGCPGTDRPAERP